MTAPAGPLASAARERARESLADNLIRCLGLLADEPARFARAAASWHAHWCLCVPQLTLADAVRARRAVDALAGPDAVPAARSLRALFDRHGLHDLADALERWLDGHADYESGTVTDAEVIAPFAVLHACAMALGVGMLVVLLRGTQEPRPDDSDGPARWWAAEGPAIDSRTLRRWTAAPPRAAGPPAAARARARG